MNATKDNFAINTTFLIIEKLVRYSFIFATTIVMAKILGVEQFGKLNFALAIISMSAIVSNMGMDQVLVKELVNNPKDEKNILGSSLVLKIFGGIVMVLLTTIVAQYIRSYDDEFISLILILSLAFILDSFVILKYWFEARVQAKYSSLVGIFVISISSIIKIYVVINTGNLIHIGYVSIFEALILSLGLISIYSLKKGNLKKWKSSYSKIKYLFRQNAPLMLSGAVFILFTRVDQVMIGMFLGDENVGIYSAAVRLSEVWLFIPAMIATSYFPLILKQRNLDRVLYIKTISSLLMISLIFGLFIIVFLSIFSDGLIQIIFGSDFMLSSKVLRIHAWSILFNIISVISFRYFLAEGLQIYSVYRAAAGLIINIVLNYYLIPIYGVVAAAYTTVFSQFIAAYLLNFINFKTREMFYIQTRCLLLIEIPNLSKNIKKLL